MGARTITLPILLSLLLASFAGFCSCHGDAVGCVPSERESLLRFKQGLRDPANRLSSWTGEDCCKWSGVGCDEHTGYVTKVDLSLNPHDLLIDGENRLHSFTLEDWEDSGENVHDSRLCLGGEIHPSLLKLKHLHRLDLSGNNFNYTPIPKFLGSFEKLKYLNLSSANFGGVVPNLLGNLSNLHVLDLSYNLGSLKLESGEWVSRLGNLQHLDISWVDLTYAADLFQALNMLPSISKILLRGCNVVHVPQSLSTMNFSTLSTLDLSETAINSTIPNWLPTVVSMQHLDLSGCNLRGSVPAGIGNITSLTNLDLGGNYLQGDIQEITQKLCNLRILNLESNQFTGSLEGAFSGCMKKRCMKLEELGLAFNQVTGYLPDWLGDLPNLRDIYLQGNLLYGLIPASLGNLSSLKRLHLGSNWLNGSVLESLGQLGELEELGLSGNNLEGILSERFFSNLTKLSFLGLLSNSLVLNVAVDWVPPFQLSFFSSCNMGSPFPAWLQTQTTLEILSISSAGIYENYLPSWIWNFSSHLHIINLSHNRIHGKLPQVYNTSLSILVLSHNSFSGPLRFPGMADNFPNLKVFDMANNDFSGGIPLSLCKLKTLKVLDLAGNQLSGNLPGCLSNLTFLELSGNQLSGSIQIPSGTSCKLKSLYLNNNNLSGLFPSWLRNCKNMVRLDLSQNKFIGSLPSWIGKSFPYMRVLSLRSNMFSGKIPPSLPYITTLQVLDLANNYLSGRIPQNFGNFSAMKVKHEKDGTIYEFILFALGHNFSIRRDTVSMLTKAKDVPYNSLLEILTSIDLSNNMLSGELPEEFGELLGLRTLNLSGNYLTGSIPKKIRGMTSLESLDLSRNSLSGEVPKEMIELTFLSCLNLSYNNLSGPIPTDHQFQTFTNLSYIGNPNLCGSPLKTCIGERGSQVLVTKEGDDVGESDHDMLWLCLGMTLGFVVGFWAFCVTLLFKREWRYSYFRFVDNIYEKFMW